MPNECGSMEETSSFGVPAVVCVIRLEPLAKALSSSPFVPESITIFELGNRHRWATTRHGVHIRSGRFHYLGIARLRRSDRLFHVGNPVALHLPRARGLRRLGRSRPYRVRVRESQGPRRWPCNRLDLRDTQSVARDRRSSRRDPPEARWRTRPG